MECICVPHRNLPGASRLFLDFLYHPDRLREFYRHQPQDPASYARAAAEIDLPDGGRAALIDALRPSNAGNPSLEKLARPGTVAVVTGQQVGLFSGPAYTVYKALTAVKLARDLDARGIPAVPVFWLATEDHDFAEVNHTWIFDPAHRPVRLEMRVAASGQPVGEVLLADPPVEELAKTFQDLAHGSEVSALVRECYAPGASMGQAFGKLLAKLLARFGLLQVDPMSPAIRGLAVPAIRAALDAAPDLSQQVLQRNRELTGAGYHAQVHVEDSTSFVFLLENGRRLTLRRHGREYVINGRRLSTEELMDRAASLSPNALLRPVVQDSILPTVAYVGGPAELAYLAQSEVIYRHVLGRMPVALNRAGFTLLDQRSRKLMERYKLTLDDFFHGEQELKERLAGALIPGDLTLAMEQSKAAAVQALDRTTDSLRAFDVTLAKAAERSQKKVRYQLDKMQKKVAREMLARDARAAGHAASLYGLIYPQRHLQERLYSILPFLASHGLGLIDQIFENVHLDCPEHQLLVI
jgi:bacillithiol biosynthesis cysteine-adding enzyme BshC